MNRPTCCERMEKAEAIEWDTRLAWEVGEDGYERVTGWAIIVDWAIGDTGKGNQPEYAHAKFCPFCGTELPSK